MSSNDAARLVLLILTAIFSSVSGFVGGLKSGTTEVQRAAIKAGHAYYATTDDGAPAFTWKEIKP